MENFYDKLVHKYSVMKVLNLELKPVGETRNSIRKNSLLEKDSQLARDFARVKELINEVHKGVINEVLEDAVLSVGLLELPLL